jgi:RNA polymerase-binding protein DksA
LAHDAAEGIRYEFPFARALQVPPRRATIRSELRSAEDEAMNQDEITSLQHKLRQERQRILNEVAETEAELEYIREEREPELVERGQEASRQILFERLDERGQREIDDIDAALRRIAAGTYGVCVDCDAHIGIERLRAMPAASLCIGCATSREKQSRAPR